MFVKKSSIIALALATTAVFSASFASADNTNRVKHRTSIKLEVGQSIIIHGFRGECGALPTKAIQKEVQAYLDKELTTGRAVFGKPGVRKSGSCNGLTPVLEVIFIAEKPGRETAVIFGDKLRIRVK